MNSYFIVTLSEKEIINNSLFKLTAINFNYNTLKLFSYVKISVNKISHLDVSISIKRVKTFLCIKILKRRQKNNDINFNEFRIKILRVALTLTAFTVNNESNKHSVKTDILTSLIYAEAVRDLIWEEMWKNVINVELTAFAVNDIWEETVSLKEINIVISK